MSLLCCDGCYEFKKESWMTKVNGKDYCVGCVFLMECEVQNLRSMRKRRVEDACDKAWEGNVPERQER